MASPEQPNGLYVVVYLIFTPATRQMAIRKPCCSDGTGHQGQDRGCQEEGGQQAVGLPVGWPRLWDKVGWQLCATCQQLLTGLARQQSSLVCRRWAVGLRWQQPELCGNAAHEGWCFALQELPAQGAVPHWAPGAGRKTQGPSSCSLLGPFHWIRTAWKPPKIKELPRSLPRYTRSILRWEPSWG